MSQFLLITDAHETLRQHKLQTQHRKGVDMQLCFQLGGGLFSRRPANYDAAADRWFHNEEMQRRCNKIKANGGNL